MPETGEEVKMPPSVVKYFSLFLILVGIIFYVLWVANDPTTWNDIAVDVITLIFLGFGSAGFYLSTAIEESESQ